MMSPNSKSNIPLVYVAGPFSAQDRLGVVANIQRAEKLGVEVARLGACPWIPHANTADPEFEKVQPYTFWIEATREQLRRCDAIIMVPGWESSSGARGEHADAIAWGKPVFYSVAELSRWLAARGAA
jgi:hypothetical protein